MTTLFQVAILLTVSLAAGTIGTVSGGGGGAFVVPVIVATFAEKPNVLVGSVFLMYSVASLTGLFLYGRKGLVDYKSGALLSIPCIPGVLIGTLLEAGISDFEFKIGLGLVTIFLASLMLLFKERSFPLDTKKVSSSIESSNKNGAQSKKSTSSDQGKQPQKSKYKVLTDESGRTFTYSPNFTVGLAVNFLGGLVNGLFGAGAAIIIVPSMILFARFPSHVAIATTRVILVALNVTGFVTHLGIGAINIYYAVILAVGAIIGSLFGARIAYRISPDLLRKVIAVLLIGIGTYLVVASVV